MKQEEQIAEIDPLGKLLRGAIARINELERKAESWKARQNDIDRIPSIENQLGMLQYRVDTMKK